MHKEQILPFSGKDFYNELFLFLKELRHIYIFQALTLEQMEETLKTEYFNFKSLLVQNI